MHDAHDAVRGQVLARRSSNSANTVEESSTRTGVASPASAATLAAAAASMTSFLRRPPRDSSRTRAVAVHGTSSTRFYAAGGQPLRQMRPPGRGRSPPPTAGLQLRRSGGPAQQLLDSRPAWPRSAGWPVPDGCPGSSALAVWVRLCGSIPMMTTHDLRSDTTGSGTAGDMPTSSTRRGTPLLSQAAARNIDRRGKPRESQPEGGRRFTSQAGRCPGGTLDHLPARSVHPIQVGGSSRLEVMS